MRSFALFVACSSVGCGVEAPAGDDAAEAPTTRVCSGELRCFAQVVTDETGQVMADVSVPSGYGPANLVSAYHLKTVTTSPGTIAVVDAYDYASAEADLAKYRAQYGLPACTSASGCFKKVNQSGAASPLPAKPPTGDDWTVEAALDLDMASAACPTCKLILVEANDDHSAGLFVAQNGAASLKPSVISNSWGGGEPPTVAAYEPYFNHAGIAIFVASGDSGYDASDNAPSYPSTSAYVTAVGGTTLTKTTATSRGWTEAAWSDGGSSCSNAVAKPSYQTSAACSKRAASDVSAVANPSTGVAVYNSSYGWIVVGGTSAASPLVAGIYTLYGLGNTAPSWAYAHAADFNDVTSGTNGSCTTAMCKAGSGWDGPTGIGTPNGAVLAPTK
jgi:subtilase family serine protease